MRFATSRIVAMSAFAGAVGFASASNMASAQNINLKIELKAFTKLRDYQSEALKAVVKDVMR